MRGDAQPIVGIEKGQPALEHMVELGRDPPRRRREVAAAPDIFAVSVERLEKHRVGKPDDQQALEILDWSATSSSRVSALVPWIASCTGRAPVSASNRSRSVSNRMRESPTIATSAALRSRAFLDPGHFAIVEIAARAARAAAHSLRAPPRRGRAPTTTPTMIRPHGCLGMSRVGTGCACPGRSDAVRRRPAGSAPSRLTMPLERAAQNWK